MDIAVIGGAPGAGKTHALVQEIVSVAAKYIIACPRIDLINERIIDIRSAASAIGVDMPIISVHSDTPSPLPVIQQIRDKMADVMSLSHAVIAITHDALMAIDPIELTGWCIAIDEQISGLSSGRHVVPTAVRLLQDSFDIAPVATRPGWGKLVPRNESITYGDALRDAVLAQLAGLIKAAHSPHGAMVDFTRWEEVEGSNRPLGWISVWTYASLNHADGVMVAAAGLEHTLTYRATLDLHPHVQFLTFEIPVYRPLLPKIIIRFFTRSHRGSSHYWSTDTGGVSGIVGIAKFLEERAVGYWGANKNVQQYFVGRLSGIQVSVKVEGTNEFRAATSCALIYSAKARFEDEPLRNYFDWQKGAIERARECEDLLQFVQRGAIRCSDFDGEYNIYVYDEWQANWLGTYFQDNGIAAVEIVAEEEPGIMHVERPKPGARPDLTRTSEQKAADRRARDRARKEKQRRAQGIKPRGK